MNEPWLDKKLTLTIIVSGRAWQLNIWIFTSCDMFLHVVFPYISTKPLSICFNIYFSFLFASCFSTIWWDGANHQIKVERPSNYTNVTVSLFLFIKQNYRYRLYDHHLWFKYCCLSRFSYENTILQVWLLLLGYQR